MRSGFRMMACGGMILALACALLPPAAFATSRMGLIVPAYQYPTLGTLWADCAAASARVPLVAVMNPASGPGAGPDPTYVSAIAPVRTAGGRVIGYVPTFAAGIPLDSALAWVDRYRAWYALDGIFLDIMANDALPGHIAWYASLRDSIRARDPSWLVVGNPGTGTLEPYVAGADVICNHESYGEGYFGWEPDAWVTSYPPSRFLHLVHTLSTSDSMRAAVSRARTRHAGWVFVTHDTMPNPWDVTPVYWNELIAAVETTWVAASPLPPPRSPGLRVWPNPSRGTVYFTLAAETQPAAVDIHDLAGRRVLRLAAERGALTWNAREGGAPTPAGMYLARPVGSRAPPARFVILP